MKFDYRCYKIDQAYDISNDYSDDIRIKLDGILDNSQQTCQKLFNMEQ